MPIEKGAFLIRYLYGASYLYPPQDSKGRNKKHWGYYRCPNEAIRAHCSKEFSHDPHIVSLPMKDCQNIRPALLPFVPIEKKIVLIGEETKLNAL